MNARIVSWFLVHFWLLINTALAAPVIDGFSGTFTHGSIVTLSGSGFGSKSPVEPVSWDNFESGSNAQAVHNVSPVIGPQWTSQRPNDLPRYSSDRAYSGNLSVKIDWIAEDYTIVAFGWTNQGPFDRLFISWWRYHRASPEEVLNDVNCNVPVGDPSYNPDHCFNHKQLYVFGDAACTGSPSVYDCPQILIGAIMTSRQNWLHAIQGGRDDQGNSIGSYTDQFRWDQNVHYRDTLNAWQRWDTYIQREEPYNTDNGLFKAWLGGRLVASEDTTDYNNIPFNWEDIRIGHMFRPHAPYSYFQSYFDDVYIDSTQARVELCNVASWSQKELTGAVCALQIPRNEWGASRLQAQVNAGSFSSGAQVWLYVIDRDGAVNSSGFPVTLGSSQQNDSLAPAAPGNLRSQN